MATSSGEVRSCRPIEKAAPSLGRVFPVIVIAVVLPVWLMMARISAWSAERAGNLVRPGTRKQ